MLRAGLYVVTAVATGAQVYWLLAWGIWGAPTSPLQYTAIGGSLTLLAAGIFGRWMPRVMGFTAIVATVAMWCFYAPALVHSFNSLPSRMSAQSGLVAFTPVVLLVLSTTLAVKNVVRTGRAR